MTANKRITLLALFIAMAVALHWMETFIPRPAPFLRFGFANIFTLTAIYLFGGAWGMVVVISRVVLGSLFAGSLFTPAFFFSLSGGIAAGTVMWVMPKQLFSPIGVSVSGAMAHMAAQLVLAALLIGQFVIIRAVPLFLVASIITGVINGFSVRVMLGVAAKSDLEVSLR